jgi:HAD superfamily hydrolase (TIGR01490 family)
MNEKAAFFDLDDTILETYSGKLYYSYLLKTNQISFKYFMKLLPLPFLFIMGIMDIESITRKLSERFIGMTYDEVIKMGNDWYENNGRQYVRNFIKEIIESHKKDGFKIIMLSASPWSICYPVFKDLEMDDLVCSELIFENNIFVRMADDYCYGQKKADMAVDYSKKHDIDLKKSYFYTDSHSDLPFLKKVGNPICVTPDKKLKKVALENNWKILD